MKEILQFQDLEENAHSAFLEHFFFKSSLNFHCLDTWKQTLLYY